MAAGHSSVKILFDETMGAPVVRAAIEAIKFDRKYEVEAVYMKDLVGSGAKDEEWVPKAAEGNWFVITGDRGRGKLSTPLPLLLPYHGISAAFMTGGLQSKRPQFEKLRATIFLWPQIRDAALGARGLRYRMQIQGESFRFVEWPLDENTMKRQIELLGRFAEELF